MLEVTACGRVIRTTPAHPFYVGGMGWTKALELQEGDLLLCEDGTSISVQSVVDTGSWETVYNFRVSEFHTYFVGCDEWGFAVWAHNASYNVYEQHGGKWSVRYKNMPTDGMFQLVERTIHALTSHKGYELWSKKV